MGSTEGDDSSILGISPSGVNPLSDSSKGEEDEVSEGGRLN